VATTWELSFQQVQQASPAGADLLNLCAFLAPDDIPRDLLSEGVEHLPQPLAKALVDPLAFDEAVAALRRYSLIEVGGDALSVHRLVQAVAHDLLAEKAHRTWAEATVCLVNSAFPLDSDDVRTWPACARLLPHALAAAGHSETLEVASEATGRLLNQTGLYLRGRAEFAEAKAAYERALAICEAVFGPDHPNVATVINNLGQVLGDLGDLEGAREAHERALDIREQKLGENHPDTATSLNDLGNLFQNQGNYAEAQIYLKRALAIYEQVFGEQHPWVATAVNNLGSLLRALGDLAGARAAHERALAIDEAAFGPEHPAVARDVNNLGTVLRDLGDLAGARAALERALAIDGAIFGPDHPNVALDLWNLGTVLQRQGEIQSAREAYGRALATFERFLGPDHQYTRGVRQYLDSLPAE